MWKQFWNVKETNFFYNSILKIPNNNILVQTMLQEM